MGESHRSGLLTDQTDHAGQPLLVQGQASGVLERGDLAPFLYRLGHAQVTGVLDLVPVPGGGEELWIERGCVATGAADPMGRVTARRLGGLAGMRRVRYSFAAGAHTGAGSLQAGGPALHLSGWARSHLEAQLDAQCARVLLEELAGPRLSIAPGCAPPATVCDEIDLRIVAAMQEPRPLHEIWRLARTSRFRLLSFLYFLRSVRALHLAGGTRAASSLSGPGACGPAEIGAGGQPEHSAAGQRGPAQPAQDVRQDALRQAERLLGVAQGADRAAIRRAYRRRARALHPDLQPQLSELQRRRLEHALAVVTDAYEQLLAAAPETPKPVR
jgi:DnaJ domain